MSIFGNTESVSLSDEALEAMSEPSEVEIDGNNTEPPQTPAPETEQQAETETPAENSVENPVEKPVDTPSIDAQLQELERRRAGLQTVYQTTKAQNAQLEAKNKELERRLAALQGGENKMPPAQAAEAFVNDPYGFLQPIIDSVAEAKVANYIKPVQEAFETQQRAENFSKSFSEVAQYWPQLNQGEEAQRALMQKVAEMSVETGNPQAWQDAPKLYLRNAAFELYGMPKVLDQEAIAAAEAKARAEATQEMQARETGKVGLAAGQAGKPAEGNSEVDAIIADIKNARGGGGVFN